MVSTWITCLELDEEFQGCLIWLPLQALNHFGPMVFELVDASAEGFIRQTALLEGADSDSAGTRLPAPPFHTPAQRAVLPSGKPA
jgi:hypothetical protein